MVGAFTSSPSLTARRIDAPFSVQSSAVVTTDLCLLIGEVKPHPTLAGRAVQNVYQAMLEACRHEVASEARAAWGLDRNDCTTFIFPNGTTPPPAFLKAVSAHLRCSAIVNAHPQGPDIDAPDASERPEESPQAAPSGEETPNSPVQTAYEESNLEPTRLPPGRPDVECLEEATTGEWLPDVDHAEPTQQEDDDFIPTRLVTAEEIAMLLDEHTA